MTTTVGRASETGTATAVGRLRYCDQPVPTVRPLPAGITANQARAIIVGGSKWLNGTVLHYCFFDSAAHGSDPVWDAPPAQHEVVRQAFATWQQLGIGLAFVEVQNPAEAEVRIGFHQSDGSWSYVGRDILLPPHTDRTMNFGWDLTVPYGRTTSLHEIGHTLGMPHEHQNPYAGIVWDDEAVYAYLAAPPNSWPRATTFNNVLRKINPMEVAGSSWDPDSIMEYAFPAGLITAPAAYTGGVSPPGTLSALDVQYMRSWYPGQNATLPLLQPFTSMATTMAPGQQVDYRLEPPGTRRYTIATFGASDTVLGLFERVDGDLRYVAADDDGGENRNSKIEQQLFAGREYVVRVRCYYSRQSATTALMYW